MSNTDIDPTNQDKVVYPLLHSKLSENKGFLH